MAVACDCVIINPPGSAYSGRDMSCMLYMHAYIFICVIHNPRQGSRKLGKLGRWVKKSLVRSVMASRAQLYRSRSNTKPFQKPQGIFVETPEEFYSGPREVTGELVYSGPQKPYKALKPLMRLLRAL